MTDTGPLRDYARSRAVLIGAWDYAHLAPVPAARNSLERVAGLLTGPLCGWPKQRVQVLRNVRRRDRLPDRLMELFDGIEDVALFYFVGHGQLYEDELCLALRESPEAGPRRTTVGLPFSDVRAALRACDAQTKIVVLDCCFAGHASRTGHTLASTSTHVIDKTLGTGAVTMAASGPYRTAWFEDDPDVADPQTYFTKYLIDVIEQGIPGYPQGLPLGPVYARTADALARDHRPEPTRSVRHDADRFILARNIAKPAEPPATVPSPDSGAEAAAPTAHRGPLRRSIRSGGLTALVEAGGVVTGALEAVPAQIAPVEGVVPETGTTATRQQPTSRLGALVVLTAAVAGGMIMALALMPHHSPSPSRERPSASSSPPGSPSPAHSPSAPATFASGSASAGARPVHTSARRIPAAGGGSSNGLKGAGQTSGSSGSNTCSGNGTSSAGSPTAPPGYFRLLNAGYGQCLDGGGGNSFGVGFGSCTDAPARLWTYKGHSDGTFEVVNEQTGQCMSMDMGGTPSMSDCTGGTAQAWRNGSDSTLQNMYNSTCLGEIGGRPSMETCGTGDARLQWTRQ